MLEKCSKFIQYGFMLDNDDLLLTNTLENWNVDPTVLIPVKYTKIQVI